MTIDSKETQKAMEQGTFFSFVPRRLEIEGLPELSDFPFNVLFMSFTAESGVKLSGSALYNPNFYTFKKNGSKLSMQYRNTYGGESWLLIDYDSKNKSWVGEKFVNGKSIGMAYGHEWNVFFIHFTMLGLKNGELCKFDVVAQ